jgi:carboxymethylenebutenolidase
MNVHNSNEVSARALLMLGLLWLMGSGALGAAEIVTFPSGDKTLHGVLYRPEGAGPFPVLLYNHGSAPGMLNSEAFEALGPVFTAHGWVFFAPYRRGQGLSSDAGAYIGDKIETARAQGGMTLAAQTMLRLLSTDQLQDQLAALAWLKTQSFITSSRIAVMGNSFGGIETVLGAEATGYCAAVDAGGGAESWTVAPELKTLMLKAVENAQAPILFFQAANDFTTEPSKVLYGAMKAVGKPAQIRIYPAYGSSKQDGHSFPYRAAPVWRADVFKFLESNCSLH